LTTERLEEYPPNLEACEKLRSQNEHDYRGLIRLESRQVTEFWETLSPYIAEALPQYVRLTGDSLNNILAAVLAGKAQCWVSYGIEEKSLVLYGTVITTIVVDELSMTRTLLIYALTGTQDYLDDSIYVRGIQSLMKFAKSEGCQFLVAYSNVDRLVRLATSRLDASTPQVLITWEIE